VLFFPEIAALVAVIAAWFAILFTGRYPHALFGFVEGVARWHNRVVGYAVTLVTDIYPAVPPRALNSGRAPPEMRGPTAASVYGSMRPSNR
jgi:Domain of unknown function (DUF4389)